LARLLDEAYAEGVVRIRRRDGREFEVRPVDRAGSPLDVPGVPLGVSRSEILEAIHEARRESQVQAPQRPYAPEPPER
jgi:hypothetical protein